MQCELFGGQEHDGQSQKTCRDSSPQTVDETLLLWLEKWLGWNLTYRETDGETPEWSRVKKDLSSGLFWTRNFGEWRSGAVVCSLSETLETGQVDRRYFLSPKACAGILRRAERRGKALPEALRLALLAVSGGGAELEGSATILTEAEPSCPS